MSKTFDEIVQIYDHLVDNFYTGELALIVFKELRSEIDRGGVTKESSFVIAMHLSTYNTLVLALANATKQHDDSIGLNYLHNCILNSRSAFSSTAYGKLRAFITKFQRSLEREQVAIDAAAIVRDTLVAHLDRRHVTNPAAVRFDPPMDWRGFERAYDIIENGLHEIGAILGKPDRAPLIKFSKFLLATETREVFRNLCGVLPATPVGPSQDDPASPPA